MKIIAEAVAYMRRHPSERGTSRERQARCRVQIASRKADRVGFAAGAPPQMSAAGLDRWRHSVRKSGSSVGRRIGKGRLAGHHLGEQPAADWSQREAVMRVAEGEPQAAMALSRPDYRYHIGEAGTPPQPRRRLQPLPERKQFAGERFVAGELDRGWWRVALGEFDARRQANTLAHRHEHVAAVGVVQGMAEHGIALNSVMHVIAA